MGWPRNHKGLRGKPLATADDITSDRRQSHKWFPSISLVMLVAILKGSEPTPFRALEIRPKRPDRHGCPTADGAILRRARLVRRPYPLPPRSAAARLITVVSATGQPIVQYLSPSTTQYRYRLR